MEKRKNPSLPAGRESQKAQRNVAAKAEQDAELVAVAAMAFADGLAVGTARAKKEKED